MEDPGGGDGDGEATQCGTCDEELFDSFWKCSECSETVCEPCFFEEGHEHKEAMVQHRAKLPDRALFVYECPITQNKLILGNYASALPGSHTIGDHNVRCVLTLIQFGDPDDPLHEAMASLETLYQNGATADNDGVRYHVIQMPDVISPNALPRGMFVLEESTCFIDAGLQKGNVLVHCQRGEKRSPTVFLAWMLTRGVRITEAIDLIDAKYRGKEGWGEVYKRTRKDWIEELKVWARTWREKQLDWSKRLKIDVKSM